MAPPDDEVARGDETPPDGPPADGPPADGPPADGPPADADEWTDDQWIDWLKRTDDADAHDVPRPVTALGRVAHSSGGTILGQAMLGMAEALYGPQQNEIVVVAQGNSEPDEDKEFTVHLDPDHPERSVVVFRSHSPDRPRA